jgi:hypothetical protein
VTPQQRDPDNKKGSRNHSSPRLLVRRLAPERLIPLSSLRGRKAIGPSGEHLGTVEDAVVRWDGADPYPLVTGIVAKGPQGELFLPSAALEPLEKFGPVRMREPRQLTPFTRRPGELRLVHDILGRQLVDVDGVQVLRAGELYLAFVLGRLRLVATSAKHNRFFRRSKPSLRSRLVDWAGVQPFGEPGSELRLQVPHEGLQRLRPDELADLLEALDTHAQEELTESLEPSRAADALEEMEAAPLEDLLHRVGPKRAAALVAEMEPDEAADALRDMERSEADAILAQLSSDQAKAITALLGYPESMAGGFMTTALVKASPADTVAEVRSLLAAQQEHAGDIDGVAVVDENGVLLADLGLLPIAIASPDTQVSELIDDTDPVSVSPEAFLDEVVDRLTQARRPSVLVVDEEGHPIGRVLADDVIDALREGGLRGRLPWLLH